VCTKVSEKEKKKKGHMASNRVNEDVEFFIEKPCPCQDLAIELFATVRSDVRA